MVFIRRWIIEKLLAIMITGSIFAFAALGILYVLTGGNFWVAFLVGCGLAIISIVVPYVLARMLVGHDT